MFRMFALAVVATFSFAAPASAAPCPPQSPCATVKCAAGYTCVPSPKQCFTTPCPQFECVPVPGVMPAVPSQPA